MKHIECNGTPRQIGESHGKAAVEEIKRAIAFYAERFQSGASLDWQAARTVALESLPFLDRHFPQYVEEIQGIADGSGHDLADILALNCRTEIMFGRFTDGCTAISWHQGSAAVLSQNWDWLDAQKENLVTLHIDSGSGPRVKQVTEAGIIGKIGFNDRGVGTTLNAIKAHGLDQTKIPCHIALRVALDSPTREQAVETLQKFGVASSCHILVADAQGASGLECSSQDIQVLQRDDRGRIVHTNHYVLPHVDGVIDHKYPEDTVDRLARAYDLLGDAPLNEELLLKVYKDEQGFPGSICRAGRPNVQLPGSTIFNIVTNLKGLSAHVIVGRPVAPDDEFDLAFP